MLPQIIHRFTPSGSKDLPLVIFQLKINIEKNTRRSIINRRVIEQTIPALLTGTEVPIITVYSSQGRGNLNFYIINIYKYQGPIKHFSGIVWYSSKNSIFTQINFIQTKSKAQINKIYKA